MLEWPDWKRDQLLLKWTEMLVNRTNLLVRLSNCLYSWLTILVQRTNLFVEDHEVLWDEAVDVLLGLQQLGQHLLELCLEVDHSRCGKVVLATVGHVVIASGSGAILGLARASGSNWKIVIKQVKKKISIHKQQLVIDKPDFVTFGKFQSSNRILGPVLNRILGPVLNRI